MSEEKLRTELIEHEKIQDDNQTTDSASIDLDLYYETNAGRLVVDPA